MIDTQRQVVFDKDHSRSSGARVEMNTTTLKNHVVCDQGGGGEGPSPSIRSHVSHTDSHVTPAWGNPRFRFRPDSVRDLTQRGSSWLLGPGGEGENPCGRWSTLCGRGRASGSGGFSMVGGGTCAPLKCVRLLIHLIKNVSATHTTATSLNI